MEPSALQESFMTSLSDEQKMKLLHFHDSGFLEELLKMDEENEIKPLVKFRKEKPQILKDIFADNIAAEPVLDYIQDLETRVQIFKDFHRLSNDLQAGGYLDSALFSVFMVAPISQLEFQLRELQNLATAKDSAGIAKFFLAVQSVGFGVQAYANRGGRKTQSASSSSRNSLLLSPAKVPALNNPLKRKFDSDDQNLSSSNLDLQASALPITAPLQPSTPPANIPANTVRQSPWFSQAQNATGSSSKQTRYHSMSKMCKDRDGNQCVITYSKDPEAAHILSVGTSKHLYFQNFISLIHTFFNPNQANSWSSIIQNTTILNSPQNLISLNHQLHWWFDHGKMALKPLRKLDDGSIVVQFHWLKTPGLKLATRLPMDNLDMDRWMHSANLEDNSSWGDMRIHRWSGIPIETGQTFILRATDPSLIPNFELLQLSWDLLRMIAICGAAEPEDLLDDNGSSSEDFGAEAFETNVSVWNEDNYVQLRHWAGDIESNEELEHDANSTS
ncbi:hypothetical protein HDV63DRAFT_403496 [Trichoderma sp. SZMC 28014]